MNQNLKQSEIMSLLKLAEQGDVEAQYDLVLIYDDEESEYYDIEKAVYWYQQTAELGLEKAIEKLEKLK